MLMRLIFLAGFSVNHVVHNFLEIRESRHSHNISVLVKISLENGLYSPSDLKGNLCFSS